MLEWLAPSFLYTLARDGTKYLLGRGRRLSGTQVIALRHKWKPLFEAEIWKCHQEALRRDVIIRDMRRIDNYPGAKEQKGISPWFRAGLVGTYFRGILIGLGWGTLTQGPDGEWRYTNSKAGEKGDQRVILIGRVRYEDIEEVEWNGDEFYNYPHIYCFFSHKKEPYEDIGFYTETKPSHGSLPFYTLLAAYEPVHRRSREHGLKYFG